MGIIPLFQKYRETNEYYVFFLNSSKLHNAGLYIHSSVFIHFSLCLSNARLLAREYCPLHVTH